MSQNDHPRPDDARKIPRVEFDAHCRAKAMREAWVSEFGTGRFDPYLPLSSRPVWGRLKATGEAVWADHE